MKDQIEKLLTLDMTGADEEKSRSEVQYNTLPFRKNSGYYLVPKMMSWLEGRFSILMCSFCNGCKFFRKRMVRKEKHRNGGQGNGKLVLKPLLMEQMAG